MGFFIKEKKEEKQKLQKENFRRISGRLNACLVCSSCVSLRGISLSINIIITTLSRPESQENY